MIVAFSFGDLAKLALSVFLVAVGLGLGWAFLRLAVTFDRLSSLIRGTEREVLPVINKVGGTVDRVNAQLDKLDTATTAPSTPSRPSTRPCAPSATPSSAPCRRRPASPPASRTDVASLRARRNWRAAVDEAKEAAARRERDLDEELKATHD